MSFPRYASTRFLTPNDDEVVEDSEPEREQKRRTEIRKPIKHPKRSRPMPTEVIELSSDDSLPSHPIISSHKPIVVIDLSDEPVIPAPRKTKETRETPTIKISTQPQASVKAKSIETAANSPIEKHHSPPHERVVDSDGRPVLNLDRFAFSNPSKPSISRNNSNFTNDSQSLAPSSSSNSKPPAKKKPTTRAAPYIVDFENLDIPNLRKCVCCDLAWTARKTDVQKMKHIQSCGKKNHLSTDTIRFLISKELGERANPATEEVQNPPPTTLLAEVANEDPPRKKGRGKKPAVETVKSLANTRNDILARARFLLDNEPPVAGPSSTAGDRVPTKERSKPQAFGQSKLAARFGGMPLEAQEADVSKAYDPTLSFPAYPRSSSSRSTSPASPLPVRSALAQRFATTSRLLDEDLISSEAYAPPSTFPVQPRQDDSSDDEDAESVHIPDVNLNSTSLRFSRDSNDRHRSRPCTGPHPGNVVDPQQTLHFSPARSNKLIQEPSFVVNPIVEADVISDNGWNDDDDGAYLHYEPNEEFQVGSSRDAELQIQRESEHCPSERLRGLLEKLDVPYKPPNPNPNIIDTNPEPPKSSPPPSQPAKRRGRPKKDSKATEKAAMKPKDISDEELFTKLRESIINDVDLHHRVLRYEPVHFDVFLQFALDFGIPTRGLKLRVRAFLDSQAIHFYGLEPSGRRTKKRHA
ncbi:hypothetical protein QCA50_000071 [Cerrena zonata]|uniref:Uncharacterized protein n=1 Tax=Cerrena zonata TaxID=2478898 RepID=A0AAW0GVS8_9APHY